MKLFIPACGDRITLSKPWTFNLWLERRNMKFAKTRGFAGKDAGNYGVWKREYREYEKVEVTLPVDTVLECDRVYIRTFNKARVNDGDDYDSITWKVIDVKKDKMEKFGRFWTKLVDCNGVDFNLNPDAFYRDRVKSIKAIMQS